MAKKYLLYIHDERFELEASKSGLVNTLLNDWYRRVKNPENPIKAPVVVPKIINKQADVMKKVLPKAANLCKHGFVLETRMCKFGCR